MTVRQVFIMEWLALVIYEFFMHCFVALEFRFTITGASTVRVVSVRVSVFLSMMPGPVFCSQSVTGRIDTVCVTQTRANDPGLKYGEKNVQLRKFSVKIYLKSIKRSNSRKRCKVLTWLNFLDLEHCWRHEG